MVPADGPEKKRLKTEKPGGSHSLVPIQRVPRFHGPCRRAGAEEVENVETGSFSFFGAHTTRDPLTSSQHTDQKRRG